VARQALAKVNRKLSKASLRIEIVPVEKCRLLEKNARYMKAEQYRQLVENIGRDGCLTSVPFGVKEGDGFLILSGNHRVQAARDAGLKEIPLLYTTAKLTRDQQLAIQLSHNAIVGEDDLAILRELYDEIGDLDYRQYSGLDDAALGAIQAPPLDPLSEQALEYRVVSVVFLPSEVERAEKVFDLVMRRADGAKVWVNRFADYDKWLDSITAAKESAGVKNTATAIGLLLDLAERHIAELPGGTDGD